MHAMRSILIVVLILGAGTSASAEPPVEHPHDTNFRKLLEMDQGTMLQQWHLLEQIDDTANRATWEWLVAATCNRLGCVSMPSWTKISSGEARATPFWQSGDSKDARPIIAATLALLYAKRFPDYFKTQQYRLRAITVIIQHTETKLQKIRAWAACLDTNVLGSMPCADEAARYYRELMKEQDYVLAAVAVCRYDLGQARFKMVLEGLDAITPPTQKEIRNKATGIPVPEPDLRPHKPVVTWGQWIADAQQALATPGKCQATEWRRFAWNN